jgi:hypothetical protein
MSVARLQNRKAAPSRPAASVFWRRRLTALAIAAVAVGGLGYSIANLLGGDEGPSGPAPQTLKKAAWGLTEHDGESLFPKYRDLGIGLFQNQARWDAIATRRPRNPTDPNDPAYVWPTYLDQSIRQARRHGMEVALQVIGSPRWASGSKIWNDAPRDPSDYGDFAAAIAERYPNVRLWMVWGEPNGKRAFHPVVDAPPTNRTKLTPAQARAPRIYAQMLDSAYRAFKSVDRRNLVIGGNTFLGAGHPVIRPYQWLRYLRLPSGRPPRLDMWGHNPYSYRKPYLENPPSPNGRIDFSDLGRLAAALDKTFPGPPKKLFLSEFGIPTEEDADFQFHVSDDVAVNWVQAAFKIVREWDRIFTLGWSVAVDTEDNPQGLMHDDLSPKPVYDAFKEG